MQIAFRKMNWLVVLILPGLILLGLAGCGGSSPTLGQTGQPTLVFVYTDG